MLESLFWFGVGLVVGWNLIPQPASIKELYDKFKGKQ
jgi:hypothetical protein